MSRPVRYHRGEFPPKELDWPRLIPLIGPASAALAKYDGVLSSIPNAAILLSPLTTQEAVLSSRIEGTQASMTEVLEFEADESAIDDPTGEKRGDIDEITRRIAEITHSQYAVHAPEFLFKSPRFKASDFYTQPSMKPASGRRMLNLLQEKGFSREIRQASGRRPAVLVYRELLNTAEGREVF